MVQCDNVFLERVVSKNKSKLMTEEHAKKAEVFVSPRIAVLENILVNSPLFLISSSATWSLLDYDLQQGEDVISLLNNFQLL